MKTKGCTADEISQQLSFFLRQPNNFVLPNVFVGSFERDMICLLPSGFWTEYEIKVSRSDFKQDFKKGYKLWQEKEYTTKHGELSAGDSSCPNRFYFVVPDGLVTVDEIPGYAGLIYFRKDISSLIIARTAKFIHKNKRSVEFTLSIMEKCYYRYWDIRYRNILLKKDNAYLNAKEEKHG